MDNNRSKPPRKRRRWALWAFVIFNVIALPLLVPVLKPVIPLLAVWWNTRSQESFSLSHGAAVPSKSPQQNADARAVASSSTGTANQADLALESLTNQLSVLEQFSDSELAQVVSQNFGSAGTLSTNTGQFDLDSAVFESISKTTINHRGTNYYTYLVKLVDQTGNCRTNLDCFLEPNLDYERSLAAMELINRSPQLKRIYRAMAGALAERSTPADNEGPDLQTNAPVLRFEPGFAPN